MFTPTHRHADGGLYQYLAKTSIKIGGIDGEGSWVPGIIYQGEDEEYRSTTVDRWKDRFEQIESIDSKDVMIWDDENNSVAAFRFELIEAGDVYHMIVKAGPGRQSNLSREFIDWMRRVFTAQADMIAQNLHIREHDFPDMIGDVAAFHAKFGQEYTGKPRLLEDDLHDFRVKFHAEETTEYSDERLKLVDAIERKDRRDIVNSLELQLDALCDAAWVILGTADLQFGRQPFIEAWKRVVKANMAKVRKDTTTEGDGSTDSGRAPKYDIVKPAGWVAPDHRDLVLDNAIFDDIFAEPEELIETNTFNQDASSYSDTRST